MLLACALKPDAPRIPLWLPLGLLARDAILIGGAYVLGKRAGHVVMSAWTGKVASGFLALIVFAVLLRADPPILTALVWITVALLTYATVVYVSRFVRIMRRRDLPPPADQSKRRGALPDAKADEGSA